MQATFYYRVIRALVYCPSAKETLGPNFPNNVNYTVFSAAPKPPCAL